MRTDRTYMGFAYDLALLSHDTSTQTGAVVVNKEGNVISTGSNIFPTGVKTTHKRLERPTKYAFTEHAERNAIYDAARNGNSTLGCTMYALWACCDECARAIIQAGISKLVTHEFYRSHNTEYAEHRKDWDTSITDAFQMLHEAGVEVEFVNFNLDMHKPVLFNGKGVMF